MPGVDTGFLPLNVEAWGRATEGILLVVGHGAD